MLPFIIIMIIGVILDQVTKAVAVSGLSGITTLPLIPNVLHLTYIENTGAAFSMFSGMQAMLIILTLVYIIVLGVVFYHLPKSKPYFTVNLALTLMLSGGIGNLIDRARLSYVIDFIDLRLLGFAVFNVADVLVVTGTVLLVWALVKNKKLLERPAKKTVRAQTAPQQDAAPKKQPTVLRVDNPVHKDVLKNLKPSEERPDITAKVETGLVQLEPHEAHTVQSVQFSPQEPPVEYDEEIRIYTPKHARAAQAPESAEQQAAPAQTEVPVKKRENRYSQSADAYAEAVDNVRTYTPSRRKNRYTERADSYAASVQKRREQPDSVHPDEHVWQPVRTPRKQGKASADWQPERTPKQKKTVKKTAPVWQPQEEPVPERAAGTSRAGNRYGGAIDHYAASVKKRKENPEKLTTRQTRRTAETPKRPAQEAQARAPEQTADVKPAAPAKKKSGAPDWGQTQKNRPKSSGKPAWEHEKKNRPKSSGKPEWESVQKPRRAPSHDAETGGSNRYYDSADQYAQAVRKASKKQYTDTKKDRN